MIEITNLLAVADEIKRQEDKFREILLDVLKLPRPLKEKFDLVNVPSIRCHLKASPYLPSWWKKFQLAERRSRELDIGDYFDKGRVHGVDEVYDILMDRGYIEEAVEIAEEAFATGEILFTFDW